MHRTYLEPFSTNGEHVSNLEHVQPIGTSKSKLGMGQADKFQFWPEPRQKVTELA